VEFLPEKEKAAPIAEQPSLNEMIIF